MSGGTTGDFPGGGGRLGNRWLLPALAAGLGVLAVLLLAGIISLLRGGGGATPTATAGGTGSIAQGAPGASPATSGTRDAATTVASALAGPTPTPSPTAPAPATPTAAGRAFIVSGTGGDGVRVRGAPGGDPIGTAPEGARLEQIGPDRDVDGVTWRNVRLPDGTSGWVAAQYTTPAP